MDDFVVKGFTRKALYKNTSNWGVSVTEDGLAHKTKVISFNDDVNELELIAPRVGYQLIIKGLTIIGNGNTGFVKVNRGDDTAVLPIYFTVQNFASLSSGLNLELEVDEKLTVTSNLRGTNETFIEVSYLEVNTPVITGLTILKNPTDVDYVVGQEITLSGMLVEVSRSDMATEIVDASLFAEYGITSIPSVGTPTLLVDEIITVSLGDLDVVVPITVVVVEITGIEVKTAPTTVEYVEEEVLDLTGLVITIVRNNGDNTDVAFADFDTNGILTEKANGDALVVEDTEVVISMGELTTTQPITVTPIV